MKNCKKCNEEFIPRKGLLSFCSLKCRNSRKQTKENNKKRSEKQKNKIYAIKIDSIEKCNYGCNEIAKYKLRNDKFCCSDHNNKCANVRYKNSNGLKQAYIEGKKKGQPFEEWMLQRSHIKRMENLSKLPFEERSQKYRKSVVLEEQNNKCLLCLNNTWNDKPLMLELDHINGDRNNNKRENLRVLCPNCHSQTDTFRGKNINISNKRYSNNELIKAINESKNIKRVCETLNITSKGGNYKTIKNQMLKLKINF